MTLSLGAKPQGFWSLAHFWFKKAPSKNTRGRGIYSRQEIGQADAIPFLTAYWINSELVRRLRSSMIRYL